MTIEDRFWSKVSIAGEDDCWLWRGAMPYDYGRFSIGSRTNRTRRTERAHRMAWLLTNGDIPNGLLVLHKCDNRSCVNPDHLYLGTYSDNMNDMYSRGRHPEGGARGGEKHHAAKLTTNDAKKIKKMYACGNISQSRLASLFGVSQTQIGRIVRGDRWKGLV